MQEAHAFTAAAAPPPPTNNSGMTVAQAVKVVLIGNIRYQLDELLDTVGKQNAIAFATGNVDASWASRRYPSLCSKFRSVMHSGSVCKQGAECENIHLVSNKPIKAHAHGAAAPTSNISLYYQRDTLHVVSNPNHRAGQRRLEELGDELAALSTNERAVIKSEKYASDDDDEDEDADAPASNSAAAPSVSVKPKYDLNDNDAVIDEDDADDDDNNKKKIIIVAIDPVGTKLRDDAISCEKVSESVIAVTSYTPNFVDTAIASGKLNSETLQRAYALYESHYIHSPERLWGKWAQNISSLSTTKTISAIAATRHYDIKVDQDGAIEVSRVSDVQPPNPLRIENVRLTDIVDYEAASRIITDFTVANKPLHFALPASVDSLEHTLALAGAVAAWDAQHGEVARERVSAEIEAKYDYDAPKYPSVCVSYRGSGSLDLDSVAHNVVSTCLWQMKNMCCRVVDKTLAFQTSQRQTPTNGQLAKLCEIAGIPPTDQYQTMRDALSNKGCNVLAVERSIGCDTSEHLVPLSDKSSLSCTKPLRSFLSCYYQFLVLHAIDPEGTAASLRSSLFNTLPCAPELLDNFNRKRDSLALTKFKCSQVITKYLALAAPHIQIPVEAFIIEVPTIPDGIMKVCIPQLTAPNAATPVIIDIPAKPSEVPDLALGQSVTLMISAGRLANPLDGNAGVCMLVSQIPPGLLPPCFRPDGVIVEGEEEDETNDPNVEEVPQLQEENVDDPRGFFRSYLDTADEDHQVNNTTAADVSKTTALPIEEYREDILQSIRNNRVMCLQGDTGCGKSTMLPVMVYLDAKANGREVTIIVTQPRRLAAKALAERVASILGETVGGTVGYRMGGGIRVESKDTRIYFVTAGYISRVFAHGDSSLWKEATHIVLDEVHERSVEADILSLIIRLKLRGDDETLHDRGMTPGPTNSKRLVVMSATIQSDLFRDYFAPLVWGEDASKPPIMRVGGSRKPVAKLYLPDVIAALFPPPPTRATGPPRPIITPAQLRLEQYLRKVKETSTRPIRVESPDVLVICDVINACVKKGSCILVFLPGLKLIEDIAKELEKQPLYSTMSVHMLHSSIDPDEQKRVLIPATMDECKVVLSTNIAETSITIPDVKIVIDVGMVNRVEYDTTLDVQRFVCGWCSKAATRQRAGRAGRVTSGVVLRMFTDEVTKVGMLDFDASELHPLESSALQMRVDLRNFGDVEHLMQQLVEPPSQNEVSNAMAKLVKWGALGPAPDYKVLSLGQLAASLPIGVRLTKAIVSAARFGCAADMIVVACGLQLIGSLAVQPRQGRKGESNHMLQSQLQQAWNSLYHFDRHRLSDVHYVLAVVEEFYACNFSAKFSTSHFLNYKMLKVFMWSVKELATNIYQQASTSGSFIQLLTDDRELMLALTATPTRDVLLRFPSLHIPLQDELFQLTVGCVSEFMFVGEPTANPRFENIMATLLATTAAPSPVSSPVSPGVLCPNISKEVVSLDANTLKKYFPDVKGTAPATCSVNMYKATTSTTTRAFTANPPIMEEAANTTLLVSDAGMRLKQSRETEAAEKTAIKAAKKTAEKTGAYVAPDATATSTALSVTSTVASDATATATALSVTSTVASDAIAPSLTFEEKNLLSYQEEVRARADTLDSVEVDEALRRKLTSVASGLVRIRKRAFMKLYEEQLKKHVKLAGGTEEAIAKAISSERKHQAAIKAAKKTAEKTAAYVASDATATATALSVTSTTTVCHLFLRLTTNTPPTDQPGAHIAMSLPHGINVLCRVARSQRNSNSIVTRYENDADSTGIKIPFPLTAGMLKQGWLITSRNPKIKPESIKPDRWSVLGEELLSVTPADLIPKMGFAFGVRKGYKSFLSDRVFLIGNLPGLPLIAFLCSSNPVPTDIVINPSTCNFTMTISGVTLGAAPLPALLMANLHLLLLGPLCPSKEQKGGIITAYQDLRMILNNFAHHNISKETTKWTLRTKVVEEVPSGTHDTMRQTSSDMITTLESGFGGMSREISNDSTFSCSRNLTQVLYDVDSVSDLIPDAPMWQQAVVIYNTAVEDLELGYNLQLRIPSSIENENVDDTNIPRMTTNRRCDPPTHYTDEEDDRH